jgi:two-component system response regulator (stage 0 sporulation protein F)
MNGLEVLQHIKQTPDRAPIPAVTWTVSERLEDIERAYLLGAAGHFVKPFDIDAQRRQLRVIRAFWEEAQSARGCPRKQS